MATNTNPVPQPPGPRSAYVPAINKTVGSSAPTNATAKASTATAPIETVPGGATLGVATVSGVEGVSNVVEVPNVPTAPPRASTVPITIPTKVAAPVTWDASAAQAKFISDLVTNHGMKTGIANSLAYAMPQSGQVITINPNGSFVAYDKAAYEAYLATGNRKQGTHGLPPEGAAVYGFGESGLTALSPAALTAETTREAKATETVNMPSTTAVVKETATSIPKDTSTVISATPIAVKDIGETNKSGSTVRVSDTPIAAVVPTATEPMTVPTLFTIPITKEAIAGIPGTKNINGAYIQTGLPPDLVNENTMSAQALKLANAALVNGQVNNMQEAKILFSNLKPNQYSNQEALAAYRERFPGTVYYHDANYNTASRTPEALTVVRKEMELNNANYVRQGTPEQAMTDTEMTAAIDLFKLGLPLTEAKGYVYHRPTATDAASAVLTYDPLSGLHLTNRGAFEEYKKTGKIPTGYSVPNSWDNAYAFVDGILQKIQTGNPATKPLKQLEPGETLRPLSIVNYEPLGKPYSIDTLQRVIESAKGKSRPYGANVPVDLVGNTPVTATRAQMRDDVAKGKFNSMVEAKIYYAYGAGTNRANEAIAAYRAAYPEFGNYHDANYNTATQTSAIPVPKSMYINGGVVTGAPKGAAIDITAHAGEVVLPIETADALRELLKMPEESAQAQASDAILLDNPTPELVTPLATETTKQSKKIANPRKKYPTFVDGSSMQGMPGYD